MSPERGLPHAPLLSAWERYVDSDVTPFTIPGHKRRAGTVWPALGRLLEGDVPLYGGLDTIKNAAATLADAERLGAELWQADWCRYSTGGSTQVNQTAALALGRPGDTVLVTRSAHRSTLSGLILAGLNPVWLPSDIDEHTGLPNGLSLAAVGAALEQNPHAAGLICVEPGYVGSLSDLPAIVALAHARNVPVVVDQAWAGHFGFHPDLPPHALQAGADVMIISAHKALPAYSQAALILARTDRLDRGRLDRAFDALSTTSPAGSILASIDAARALLASSHAEPLLGRLIALVAEARGTLRAAGVTVAGPESFEPARFDPAKLVLLPDVDGLALEQALLERGVPVEQADHTTVLAIVTMLDDADTVTALCDAVIAAYGSLPRTDRSGVRMSSWRTDIAPAAMTPRDAFFAGHRTVRADDAIGRVSAELIAPYPPGIPILVPGEVITAATVDALTGAARRGVRIAYAQNPTLTTFVIVDTEPSMVE